MVHRSWKNAFIVMLWISLLKGKLQLEEVQVTNTHCLLPPIHMMDWGLGLQVGELLHCLVPGFHLHTHFQGAAGCQQCTEQHAES